jgi:citrate lyase subunit beta/citryl-CoA lyase
MQIEPDARAPKIAEAGRRGDDVRSDVHVRFEPASSGGLDVALAHSKVGVFYGTAIVEDARAALEIEGVSHGRLIIDDAGALPFVLRARIACAVSRAGVARNERPRLAEPSSPATAKDRLRRSRLYLPGNDPKLFLNAGLYEADAVILDLEDSVHPVEKDAARHLVREALRSVDFGASERMVRINQLPGGLDDLDVVVPERPHLILVPKVEHAEEVVRVAARVEMILGSAATDRPLWLMPILETALGIENAFDIARASERVAALTIGLEDYTADLGVRKTGDGHESAWARARLVNAARAAGVQAIDSVYGDVDDLEGLARWGRAARGLGFVGMGCIHPRQIPVVHEAFAPSTEEISRALAVVRAHEDAQRRGLGVVSLGSKMIDAPVVRRAAKLVEQARAMGLVDRDETEEGS